MSEAICGINLPSGRPGCRFAHPGYTLPLWAIGAALALLMGPPAKFAFAQTDFYKGKTVTLVVGYSVGGGYDQYARALARHFGSHIPGNPSVLVQNMPGDARLT